MENDYRIENLKAIAANTEQPVYLFNADKFIRNFTDLQDAFRKIYPNTMIAYSYKTNYTPDICNLVKELGGYAEVVSPVEYDIAKSVVGNFSDRIIYNGVLEGDIRKYIMHGSIVNVGSWKNLCKALDALANEKIFAGNRQTLGIRIAINEDSRFGFTEEEVQNIVQTANKRKTIISGVHCHVGGKRDIPTWINKTNTVIRIAKMIEEIQGKEIKYIDLGGHLFGRMSPELKNQFDGHVPSFEEYAENVATIVKESFEGRANPPKLILEPGTALVADAVEILASVKNVVIRKNGKRYATLDISSYDCGMVADYKNLPIVNIDRPNPCISHEYSVCGYTCMEEDYINREYVGNLREGNVLMIKNCGAYSLSLKGGFIYPSIAMYRVNDQYEVMQEMKRANNIFDVLAGYRIGGKLCNQLQ